MKISQLSKNTINFIVEKTQKYTPIVLKVIAVASIALLGVSAYYHFTGILLAKVVILQTASLIALAIHIVGMYALQHMQAKKHNAQPAPVKVEKPIAEPTDLHKIEIERAKKETLAKEKENEQLKANISEAHRVAELVQGKLQEAQAKLQETNVSHESEKQKLNERIELVQQTLEQKKIESEEATVGNQKVAEENISLKAEINAKKEEIQKLTLVFNELKEQLQQTQSQLQQTQKQQVQNEDKIQKTISKIPPTPPKKLSKTTNKSHSSSEKSNKWFSDLFAEKDDSSVEKSSQNKKHSKYVYRTKTYDDLIKNDVDAPTQEILDDLNALRRLIASLEDFEEGQKIHFDKEKLLFSPSGGEKASSIGFFSKITQSAARGFQREKLESNITVLEALINAIDAKSNLLSIRGDIEPAKSDICFKGMLKALVQGKLGLTRIQASYEKEGKITQLVNLLRNFTTVKGNVETSFILLMDKQNEANKPSSTITPPQSPKQLPESVAPSPSVSLPPIAPQSPIIKPVEASILPTTLGSNNAPTLAPSPSSLPTPPPAPPAPSNGNALPPPPPPPAATSGRPLTTGNTPPPPPLPLKLSNPSLSATLSPVNKKESTIAKLEKELANDENELKNSLKTLDELSAKLKACTEKLSKWDEKIKKQFALYKVNSKQLNVVKSKLKKTQDLQTDLENADKELTSMLASNSSAAFVFKGESFESKSKKEDLLVLIKEKIPLLPIEIKKIQDEISVIEGKNSSIASACNEFESNIQQFDNQNIEKEKLEINQREVKNNAKKIEDGLNSTRNRLDSLKNSTKTEKPKAISGPVDHVAAMQKAFDSKKGMQLMNNLFSEVGIDAKETKQPAEKKQPAPAPEKKAKPESQSAFNVDITDQLKSRANAIQGIERNEEEWD